MLYPLNARTVLAIGLGVSALAGVAPCTARAATIFSDLGSDGSYGYAYYGIYGSNGAAVFWPIYGFTAAVTASLGQIDVALTAGTPGQVSALLFSSTGGAPGTLLGSYSLTNLPTSGSSLATTGGINGVSLTAGTVYFLGLQTLSGEYGFDVNTQGVTGSAYDEVFGDLQNQGTVTTGAFDLLGSAAVPEPRSVALFAAGLAGLAWLRRRKAA